MLGLRHHHHGGLLLLLLLFLSTTATSAPFLGLDSFLTNQHRLDPQANNDTLLSLPSSLKSALSHSFLSPLSLSSLSLSSSFNIRLVGPTYPSTSSSLLRSFLSSTSPPITNFHVIAPFPGHTHSLSISQSLHFDVTHAPSSLSSSIAAAISAAADQTAAPVFRGGLVPIPYNVVDEIIRQDFEKQNPNQDEIFLYFIALDLKNPNPNPKTRPYAYRYTPGDTSAGFTNCLGTLWTGKERYAWIDLSAGPVDYGPGLSGDGVMPRGEFHPLSTLHGSAKSNKAVFADLASLVWSAYEVMVVPSLRIPVPFENSLVVMLIHVYTGESPDVNGLDWKRVESVFRDSGKDSGLLVGDQHLSFKNYGVKYRECSICSFAISRSINSYTSRFLFDNYTLIVNEYLDSKRLHQVLSDSSKEFRGIAGFHEEDFGRVLPVYVFDLDYPSSLLLDRYHQSVAFKDMVIAVRTKNTQTVSDYSCNSRHVFTQTRELERPLVGSILQSMWGVSPTHMSWSPRHNSTVVDYTWSVGHTPFGPFSEVSSLSFVQKDAARRNVLLTSLNQSITSAMDVLESILAHGGDRKLLKHNQHTEFVQRWNLFRYKLDKVVSALSHYDFDMALFYLRSSDHDLYGIHSLVYHASQELEASLVCFKDPPFPWVPISVYSGLVFGFLYVYTKRDKLFRNKRKQF